jgi:hydrogenase nickel incorporation protein HypB
MCGICGCGDHEETKHSHPAVVTHHHHDIVQIEQDLLAKNNRYAEANRAYCSQRNITGINVMSSPGSGKTTLLARTFADLNQRLNLAVIVGDQQTDEDAKKLKAAGAPVIQVNTGKVCHLDAHMVGHSIEELAPKSHAILFIENVGNLVCPALFDLGESFRVVFLSVTEGDNKPLKYPDMFRRANLIIVTKIDLLPYVDFDTEKALGYIRRINPSIQAISLSATTGEGLDAWYHWLTNVNAS